MKCATHMVNLGAEAHQFVLLSNRNSVGGSFHDELLIDRFFSHFCCISEFYWSFSISCFYGLQWILYCVWYLFMDYFVIFIPKMVRWLRWKQQNIIKPQHCEWCLKFKLNWKASWSHLVFVISNILVTNCSIIEKTGSRYLRKMFYYVLFYEKLHP